MYIIKISQHFTGHLIKMSGAVPKGINLDEASSTHYSAVLVSAGKMGLAPWEGVLILQGLSHNTSSRSEGPLCHFPISPKKEKTQKDAPSRILSADVGSSPSPQFLLSVRMSLGICPSVPECAGS